MARNAIADTIRKNDKSYAAYSFYHRVDARIGALATPETTNTVYPLGWLVSTGRVSGEFCERILDLTPIALAKMVAQIHSTHANQCVRDIADEWKRQLTT